MPTKTGKAVGGADALTAMLAIAAAVNVAAPIAEKHEGYRGAAYYDPAHVLTQCYGETKEIDPSRIYSKDECAKKLRQRMAKDYAPIIGKCIPRFVGEDWNRYTNMFGALLDASYNAGPYAVCQAYAPLVNSGQYLTVCNKLPGWYTTARNRATGVRKTYPGLVKRRKDEQAVCLTGLPI